MFSFGEKHPVLFEILLFVVSFLAAAAFTIAGDAFNLHPSLSSSVGRVIVGAALFVIYQRAFKGVNRPNNLVILLPALLFAAWNFFYNLRSGEKLGGLPFFVEAFITAIAPAIYEEVLFRGIFLYNLKKSGRRDPDCLWISALVFAAVHLTNIAGLGIAGVALQLVYSFVIGLVLAAVYLKNGRILQVVLVHFLIDFVDRIFVEQPSSASYVQLILFGLLLAAETFYAVKLTRSKKAAE